MLPLLVKCQGPTGMGRDVRMYPNKMSFKGECLPSHMHYEMKPRSDSCFESVNFSRRWPAIALLYRARGGTTFYLDAAILVSVLWQIWLGRSPLGSAPFLAKEAAQNGQQLSASIPQFEATHNLRGKFTNPALQLITKTAVGTLKRWPCKLSWKILTSWNHLGHLGISSARPH